MRLKLKTKWLDHEYSVNICANLQSETRGT